VGVKVRATTRWVSIWFGVPTVLLAVAFASQRLFDSLLLARLQIEGVPLDVRDDAFLQYLPLKAFECAFQALAILKPNFRQRNSPRFLIDS
jgi:hypothetical protein